MMQKHLSSSKQIKMFIASSLLVFTFSTAQAIPINIPELAPPAPGDVVVDTVTTQPVIPVGNWITTSQTTTENINGVPTQVTRNAKIKVPNNPKGLVMFFHGTTGSADTIDRSGSMVITNALYNAGYAVAALDSYKRYGDRHWDPTPDVVNNQDWLRVKAVRQQFLNTTGLSNDTPWFGWGFSWGGATTYSMSRMAALEGIPMSAIATYSGPGTQGLIDLANPLAGEPAFNPPPVFQAVLENDLTGKVVNGILIEDNNRPADMIIDHQTLDDIGATYEYHLGVEKLLQPERFLRIDGINQTQAQWIFDQLVTLGYIDANGLRTLNLGRQELPSSDPDFVDLATDFTNLGLSADLAKSINQEMKIVWARHTVSDEFVTEHVSFFDSQLTAVPLPPAIWFFGSAIAGLFGVCRQG